MTEQHRCSQPDPRRSRHEIRQARIECPHQAIRDKDAWVEREEGSEAEWHDDSAEEWDDDDDDDDDDLFDLDGAFAFAEGCARRAEYFRAFPIDSLPCGPLCTGADDLETEARDREKRITLAGMLLTMTDRAIAGLVLEIGELQVDRQETLERLGSTEVLLWLPQGCRPFLSVSFTERFLSALLDIRRWMAADWPQLPSVGHHLACHLVFRLADSRLCQLVGVVPEDWFSTLGPRMYNQELAEALYRADTEELLTGAGRKPGWPPIDVASWFTPVGDRPPRQRRRRR